MKSTVTALLIVVTLCSTSPAQKLERLPGDLQGLLDQALTDNPEIIVARARVAEAEAELQKLQLQITRDIVRLNIARKTQAANISAASERLAVSKKLKAKGMADEDAVRTAEMALVNARGKLEENEAALRYSCGLGVKGTKRAVSPTAQPKEKQRVPTRPPRSDAMDATLAETVDVSFSDVPLKTMIESLSGMVKGFSVIVHDEVWDYYGEEVHSLRLSGKVTLESALTAMTDRFPECVFVLRDYGVLMTTYDRAEYMRAPSIPWVKPGWVD